MLDKWYRFHKIKGDEDDRGYQRMAGLRKVYGRYDKKQSNVVDGDPVPPGSPTLLHLPNRKGDKPNRGKRLTESELADTDL